MRGNLRELSSVGNSVPERRNHVRCNRHNRYSRSQVACEPAIIALYLAHAFDSFRKHWQCYPMRKQGNVRQKGCGVCIPGVSRCSVRHKCFRRGVTMKGIALSAALVVFSITNSAQAGLFGLFNHGSSCGSCGVEPSCCAPVEASCCAPAACAPAAPSCCAPAACAPACEPTCCAPAACAPACEPTCCAPAGCGNNGCGCNSCGDGCGHGCGGFKMPKLHMPKLRMPKLHMPKLRMPKFGSCGGGCGHSCGSNCEPTCCAPAACEPSCCAPVAPSCACPCN